MESGREDRADGCGGQADLETREEGRRLAVPHIRKILRVPGGLPLGDTTRSFSYIYLFIYHDLPGPMKSLKNR